MNTIDYRIPTHATRHERVLVLAGLALALLATPVMLLLSVPAPVIGGVWAFALVWTVVASLGHALWLGFSGSDWSRFQTPCDDRSRQEDFDFATKSGAFAFMRVRGQHEDLMRDGDRFLHNHDHLNPR